MLDAGVRALDIRLRHKDDSFSLEHGIIELPYEFDADVRDVLALFLEENPTETVIVFYQVNEAGSNTRTAEETLQVSMDEYPNLWTTGSTVPTLGDARGKVVLANDMERQEQNEYEVTTFADISDKKGLIRDFFLESGPVDNTFRVNYFSASGIFVYPLTVAAGVLDIFQGTNEVVFEFSAGFLGITLFDFIGEDAIAHVVAQQVRLDFRERFC